MYKIVISAISILLLTACSDVFYAADTDRSMAANSEACRSTVSEQLSRERSGLNMTSDEQRMAYEQRYRFCMGEKGYTLPPLRS